MASTEIYDFMVSSYANKIYLIGNQRFTARDGYSGIPIEYHEPVKKYAAKNYDSHIIDEDLTLTWLLENEYADTEAYAIGLYGVNRLTARNGYYGVRSYLYTMAQQSMARLLTTAQIDTALANGWLSQQEYDEVMSYVI